MDPSEESLNTMLEAFSCRSVHLDWWIMLRRWRRNGCQVQSAFGVQKDCCFSWVGGQVVEHLVGLLVVVSEAIISILIMRSLWRFEKK